VEKRIFLFLLLFSFVAKLFALHSYPKERLVIGKIFPQEIIYFKAVPPIDADELGNIYAVGNREHTVYKFDSNGKFLLKFGGFGQGPGDLQWPYYISSARKLKQVIVFDNVGLSIYSEKGRFINRIRIFSPALSIYASPNNILLLQPTENNLINEFNYNGKFIKAFGSKYKINYSLHKNISPRELDLIINDGAIFSDDSSVYYFTSFIFGDIFKYDATGKIIIIKKFQELKGRENNETLIYKRGLKRNKDDTISTPPRVIQAAYLQEDYLFLLVSYYGISGDLKKSSPYEIWVLSKDNFYVKKRYFLDVKDIEPMHLCVSLNKKENLLYISFYDKAKEQNLIGLLKRGF